MFANRKQVMNVVDGGGSRERERDMVWTWEGDVTRFANWPDVSARRRGGEVQVWSLAWLPGGRRVLSSEIKVKPDEEEQVWEY